jgi:hypothetical protein
MKKPPTDPMLQGEGNYHAARRHRASAQKFISQGKVPQAAAAAAPNSDKEAQDLLAAEAAGRAPAKK